MSEIEKMYENANIKAKEYCDRDSDACMACCPEWENRQDCWKYKSVIPQFTAEKQIELIKFLMQQEDFSWTIAQQGEDAEYIFYIGYEYSSGNFGGFKEFTEALAGIINNLWQDLTEEERKQIKEILNG